MPRHTFEDNRFHSHYRETARLDRGKSFLELTTTRQHTITTIVRSILSLSLSLSLSVSRIIGATLLLPLLPSPGDKFHPVRTLASPTNYSFFFHYGGISGSLSRSATRRTLVSRERTLLSQCFEKAVGCPPLFSFRFSPFSS